MKLNLKKIISEYLGREYSIKSVREIPGGFRAKAYRVLVLHKGVKKQLFLKHPVAADPPGLYEDNIDKLGGYLLSQEINDILGVSPRSLGVFLFQNNKVAPVAPPQGGEVMFQLQEFQGGEVYLDYLYLHEKDKNFLEDNQRILDQVIKKLVAIHKKAVVFSSAKKKLLYKKSLRTPLTHPQMAMAMIEENIEGSLFEGKFRYAYVMEMMKVAEYFWPRYERFSVVHGDFWPGNILLGDESPLFIDYSRYGYGDPGVDVGYFYLSLVFFSLLRKNKQYLQLAEYFLERYAKVARDPKIKETAVAAFGQLGVVFILDDFFPGLSKKERKRFASYVMKSMQKRRVVQNYF